MQKEGLAAWDCVYEEEVLYIPWALGLLGDIPMQSELSSHVGMQGKYFCRVCTVHGKDATRKSGFEGAADRINEFLNVC